jgi:hypothetical protein
VDFSFAVDFGVDTRWTTEVRVKRGEPAKQIRLPTPAGVEIGPFLYLAEVTQTGQARLQMLSPDGRPIDGAVTILRLDGRSGMVAITSGGPWPHTIQYAAVPVGDPINPATAWMPGETPITNAAGQVIRSEPCQIPPGAEPGRCRPLSPARRVDLPRFPLQ